MQQYWNFTLIFRSGAFDLIKWKNFIAWSEKEEDTIDKGKFIGSSAGLFFFDVNDAKSWEGAKELIEVFGEKTNFEAPFLLYGLVENKAAVLQLKTDKEKLEGLAYIRKWVSERNGVFKLENLADIKLNLTLFINEFSFALLQSIKDLTDFSEVKLKQIFYLDYEDLEELKNIEILLERQAKEVEGDIDDMLLKLFLQYMKVPEVKVEEVAVEEPALEVEVVVEEPPKPIPIKEILRKIKETLRRTCPICSNQNRNMIREVVDRDYIIMDYPRVYGMKLICGQCGAQWR